mmetsp:Transcript_5094/g.18484  ORF Transcript_5094/g.18484 Transcript_5094/m.18484 type:complete len:313 (-) Transcript_5094:106-1044(-)
MICAPVRVACAPRRARRVAPRAVVDVDDACAPPTSSAPPAARTTRRLWGCASAMAMASYSSTSTSRDAHAAFDTPRVTHRAFLDVGACDTIVRADKALGDGAVCSEPEMFGRIELELYGDAAPATVRNFIELCRDGGESTLRGTTFHKIQAGEYVVAGKSGSSKLAMVTPLASEKWRNTDVLSSRAFDYARHFRPGTLSLALESAQADGDYGVPTQFLITTGPAPVPRLDGSNIVFGRVTRGLDVVSRVASTPTFQPSDTARAYNALANFVGDSRASKARAAWSKPTRALVITATGVESVANTDADAGKASP